MAVSQTIYEFINPNYKGASTLVVTSFFDRLWMFLFLLIITTKVQAELFGCHFQIKDGTSFSKENTLWTGKTGSIMSCSHLCARREACNIAMFWVNQRTCSLLDTAQREEGQKRPQQDDVFYLQKVW